MSELKDPRFNRGEDSYYIPWCWPWFGRPSPVTLAVIGGITAILGTVWLLIEVEILPQIWEKAIGPAAVILIGVAYLLNSLSLRD